MAETAIRVNYGNETYELAAIPLPNSAIVQACKKTVLDNLDLGELITNLDRASELLFLAYNGVAAFGELVAGVDELQNKFLKLLNDGQVTMASIEASSRNVLNTLAAAFAELLDEEEDSAIELLSGCEQIAGKLESASARLAESFNKLAEDTVQVLVKTHQAKGNQREEALALERQIEEFKASSVYLEELKSKLAESKEQVEKLYNEAREKQTTEEERAFSLAITESIFGAVGKGLGASADVKSPAYPGYPAADPGADADPAKPKPKPRDETVVTGGGPIDGASEPRKPVTTKQARQLQTYFNESVEDLKNIRSSSDASAASWRQEKLKYFDLLLQMQDQERQAIAKIAEYATRMSNLKVEVGVAVSAGESLHQAVGCLKEVATTLRTASTSWAFMKNACSELAKADTRKKIKLWQKYPREKKFSRYNGKEFKNTVLFLFGGWKALELVTRDYRNALNAISVKEEGFIRQNPSIEASRGIAREMANRLLQSTGDAEAKLRELDEFILQQKAKLLSARPAGA